MAAYDTVVIGVGGMGSAACLELARRGVAVLGLEQFGPAHDRGSSHGQSRVIRKSYFEHPDYVPLLHRAYELWARLEAETGRALFERCGLLLAGPPGGRLISGCRRTAVAHGLALEEVAAEECPRRFPGFHVPGEMSALYERDAGFLRVEECVRAAAQRAADLGAELRWNTPVRSWSADGSRVRVVTDSETITAARLIVCAGPWAGRLLAEMSLPLEVRRKVMLWVDSANPAHRLDRGGPVFAFDHALGFIYGFPGDGQGRFKIANHTGGEPVADPAAVDRALRPSDGAFLAEFLALHMPGADPTVRAHAVCMYTMTPDEHFVIDRLPDRPQVVFAAGFSGHGFKFAPLVGALLADLALEGRSDVPIGFLSASRLRRIAPRGGGAAGQGRA